MKKTTPLLLALLLFIALISLCNVQSKRGDGFKSRPQKLTPSMRRVKRLANKLHADVNLLQPRKLGAKYQQWLKRTKWSQLSDASNGAPSLGQKLKAITTVNIRPTPCTGTTTVGQLTPGKTAFFTGEVETGCGFTWYSIQVDDSTKLTGWIASNYVTEVIGGDQGSAAGMAAAFYAKQMVGKDYSSTSTVGPNSFNAPGLIKKAYESAGKTVPTSLATYGLHAGFSVVSKVTNIQIGDLLYSPSTVGIYVGDDNVVSAEVGGVKQRSLAWYEYYVEWDTIYRVL